jgi:peptidyl-prolyl cis-trans isomerase B (cyclophilin B)
MTDSLEGVTAVLDTTEGSMTISFLPDKAPNHVENFVKLSEDGFYDGTVFHRVIAGFMIQGGCPHGTGTGGPGHNVNAEFNDTPHVRGVVSMARASDPNSAGSQFFICHDDAKFLDGQYTAFGRLVEGDEILEKIATAPVRGEKPVEPVKVTKVTIVRPS